MASAKSQADLIKGMQSHEQDPFLNISTIAVALGKSHQTIGRWILDGVLRATPWPSGGFKVRKSDLEKVLSGSSMSDDTGIVANVEKLLDESE